MCAPAAQPRGLYRRRAFINSKGRTGLASLWSFPLCLSFPCSVSFPSKTSQSTHKTQGRRVKVRGTKFKKRESTNIKPSRQDEEDAAKGRCSLVYLWLDAPLPVSELSSSLRNPLSQAGGQAGEGAGTQPARSVKKPTQQRQQPRVSPPPPFPVSLSSPSLFLLSTSPCPHIFQQPLHVIPSALPVAWPLALHNFPPSAAASLNESLMRL